MKKYLFSELLKQDEVVIHTPKSKQKDILLAILAKKKYLNKDTADLFLYLIYNKNTCFHISNVKSKSCSYGSYQYWEKEGFKIIEFANIDFKEKDLSKKARTFNVLSVLFCIFGIIATAFSSICLCYENIELALIGILIALICFIAFPILNEFSQNCFDEINERELENKNKRIAELERELKTEKEKKPDVNAGKTAYESLKQQIDDITRRTYYSVNRRSGKTQAMLVYHGQPIGDDIKVVYHNKEKGTTCVIFNSGKKVIVKRKKGTVDDVYTAVAYAITKRVYGSNTTFIKMVDKKLDRKEK